jgi:hypothetical protein
MFTGTSAKALEFKTGLTLNSMAAVANAQEILKDSGRVTNKTDAIAMAFGSAFAEVSSEAMMGLGFGVSFAPEVVSLNDEERNIQVAVAEPDEAQDSGLQKIAADIDDLVNIYVTLPVGEGAYLKAGLVYATMNTKEKLATGSEYSNISMEGISVGGGYEGEIGSSAFWRAEGTYQQWDDLSATGSQAGGGTPANNKITAELGGVTGSLSVLSIPYWSRFIF